MAHLDTDRICKALDNFKADVASEFRSVKQLIKEGAKVSEGPNNNNSIDATSKSTTHKPRVSILGPDNGNGRKRSLSRGRGPGHSKGPGRGERASSRGPPAKHATTGNTPCPFCNEVTCKSPTRCAISYDWDSRIAVHARKRLCPQYTCLKAHHGRCWKFNHIACPYCEGHHHIAWCRELALDSVRSNTGSEPYDPREFPDE